MGNHVSCPSCGAVFDPVSIPEGPSFRCGACNTVIRLGASAPPPLPRQQRPSRQPLRRLKKRADLGKTVALDDPEKARAQRRMRAGRLCTSSLGTGVAAAVCAFLLWLLPATLAGIAAVGLGIWGLIGMARVGLGRTGGRDVSALERVSARVARRARSGGVAGVLLGAGSLLFLVWWIYSASRGM